jgi:hypothetical protein
MQRDQTDSRSVHGGRRRFLQGLALVGGVGSLAAVSKGAGAFPAEAGDEAASATQTGYHETEHIRTYYQKARI